jgi:membrane protease YdiL (CAAX protease family)
MRWRSCVSLRPCSGNSHDEPNVITRLIIGFLILSGVLQGAASALGSRRGEWGVVVALLVAGAGVLIARLIHNESWRELGLGAPARRGIWTALCLAGVLLVASTIYALVAGAAAEVTPATLWLLLGIFAQGGIAEELVFRGYLFGRIRRTYPFWRAALMSAIPFALLHLTLFLTSAWAIALTALVMSIAMTLPLSWLYERFGHQPCCTRYCRPCRS